MRFNFNTKLKRVIVNLLAVAMVFGLFETGGTLMNVKAETRDSLDTSKINACDFDGTPLKLAVLAQSVTDSGFTVVWNKPNNYSDITDYKIIVSGNGERKTYYASDNNTKANEYIKEFYEQGIGNIKDTDGNVIRKAYHISMHTYCLSGLAADTSYTVKVESIDSGGNVSPKVEITQKTAKTTPSGNIINIEDEGAVGDGVLADDAKGKASTGTLNTTAIQKAIDKCPSGGTVLIPEDKIYVTGPITLHSDMTLDIEGTLLGTPDASQYPNVYDTDKTQTKQKSAPLISTSATGRDGKKASYENIRIVGNGTINGNGWAKVSSKDTSVPFGDTFDQYQAGKKGTVTTAAVNHLAANQYNRYLEQGSTNAYATRSNLIVINDAKNVYIGDGLTVTNPSMHTTGFEKCKNVVINGLIASTYNCNNGDGVNFTYSTGLTVVNSIFNTGDDCVNFAAGVGVSGEKNDPVGGAWVFDNYFGRGHGVIAAGSHTASWIEDILAEDNVCNGTAVGLRCKSQSGNGGGARNIVFRDSAMANITDNDGSAFLLTDSYSAASATKTDNWADDEPTFHDLTMENCTVNGTKKAAISFKGSPNGYDYNIIMSNIAFAGTNQTSLSYLKNCTFNNVVFYGLSDPWAVSPNVVDSDGNPVDGAATLKNLIFTGNTTQPDPSIAPNWPAGSTLTETNVKNNSATLNWTAATGDNLSKYIIKSGDTTITTVNANTTNCSVSGLTSAELANLTVYAENSNGNIMQGPTFVIPTKS